MIREIFRKKNYKEGNRILQRMEAFSDSIFAFSISVLIFSTAVPINYSGFITTLEGIIPFGLCFLFIMIIWKEHARFFDLFPIYDSKTQNLNGLLLFLILFYIFPLKYIFTIVAKLLIINIGGLLGLTKMTLADQEYLRNAIPRESRNMIYIVFALGWIGVFGTYALLYQRAKTYCKNLVVPAIIAFEAKAGFKESLFKIAIPIVAIILVIILSGKNKDLSNFVYVLNWPLLTLFKRWKTKQIKLLKPSIESPPADFM